MKPESHPITKESIKGISNVLLKKFYTEMVRIREFEEKTAELVAKGEIKTPCHLYIGQEAIATGVCLALEKNDYVWGTHRSHGHYLAKGGDMNALMAELFGKQTGCSGGKGGSMHLCAPEVYILGTVPIVGATIPHAVGSALASKLRTDRRISVSFFGDGAVNEGVWHESLNFAALKKLPVIFICENNFYSSHFPLSEHLSVDNIAKRVESYGIPGIRIDGNNAIEVYRTAKKAVEHARNGKGPSFIEARTYRWRGHVGANYDLELGIRDKATLERWMERCPIKTLRAFLVKEKFFLEAELEKTTTDAKKEVEASLAFAKKSPLPNKKDLLKDVFR